MKFYVATSLDNAEQAQVVASMLRNAGHKLTYDWTVHGSVQGEPDRWEDTAAAELWGVVDADAVIALLPGGRGTHTEIGIAIGQGKRVFIWGQDESAFRDFRGRTCIFYHCATVSRHTASFAGMLAAAHAWSEMPEECAL